MKKSDFNIYYLNFSKVYEMSMMINNVLISSIEQTNKKYNKSEYGYSSSLTAKGSSDFLNGIKASLSSDAKETSYSSTKVVENLDVKTTKSILLRRIIDKCNISQDLSNLKEGDLIKIDNVKLKILDEESLFQFLMLRRDALKGFRIEGMEINNLISSALNDYAYILTGKIIVDQSEKCTENELIIKIPLEIQNEFENKYNINDLVIGHVSIIGVYKGKINENVITSSTLTYLKEIGSQQNLNDEKIFVSDEDIKPNTKGLLPVGKIFDFVDVIAIVQDVNFDVEQLPIKRNWFQKLFAKVKGEKNV